MIDKPKNNITVLIADSSIDYLHRIGKYLRREGFNVLTAIDGNQALAIALNKHPHIILLEVIIPVVDGFAVCRSIKKHCHVLNTAVIMMAELSAVSVTEKVLAAGAHDFISKPFQMDELLARIHATLKMGKKPAFKVKKSEVKKGQTALLVEDNELNQRYVQAIVQDLGFSVDIAENGEIGLEKYVAGKYDLVITDINVPLLNGLELARIIRSRHSADVPIIAISGHSEKELTEKCLDTGINAFVTKPFTTKELKTVIHKIFLNPHLNNNKNSFEKTRTGSRENKAYNYDRAVEIAKGDEELLKKWIKRFNEIVKSGLENVNSCISANEYPQKNKIFHELVNYSDYFGLDELRSYIQELNSILEFSSDKERVGNFYRKIEAELRNVDTYYKEKD